MTSDQLKRFLSCSDEALAMLDKLIGYSKGSFSKSWDPAEQEYWMHIRRNIIPDPKRWLRGKKFTNNFGVGRFFFVKDLGEMLKILVIEKDGKIFLEDHSQLGREP